MLLQKIKRRERMELALYLCPAPPPPQVFELLSANLLFLSLAQPLCNSCHYSLPHSLCTFSFAFLQLFNSISRGFSIAGNRGLAEC